MPVIPSIGSAQQTPLPMARQPLSAFSLLIVVLAAILCQLLAYHDAFAIKPAGDDHLLVAAIYNGSVRGPGWFFTDPPSAPYYRPGKEWLTWLFGRISDDPALRAVCIRILAYASFVPLVTALVLWLRYLRASLPFAAAALAVLFFHPCLPATLSSIDGLGGMFVSGFIWLAAYVMVARPDNELPARAVTLAAFAVSLIFKEYVFALIPLTAWSFVLLPRERRWRRVGWIVGPQVVMFAGYLIFRHWLMGPSDLGYQAVARSPRPFFINLALASAGLIFPGNSVWVFFHRSLPVLAGVGAICGLVVAWILFGVIRPGAQAPVAHLPEQQRSRRKWAVWLVIAIAIMTFPCILRADTFAEKYLAPMLLPAALLAGFAVQGWAGIAAPGLRRLGAIAGFVALLMAVAAVLDKNALMRASGERAERLALQLLAATPPDARRVDVIFLVPPGHEPVYFSVYVIPEEISLGDPDGLAFVWWQPNRDLRFFPHRVASIEEAKALSIQLCKDFSPMSVFLWNAKLGKFDLMNRTSPH